MSNNNNSIAPQTDITGDLAVSRNVVVGGKTTMRGDLQLDQGLTVNGPVNIKNLNLPTAGVFASAAALSDYLPSPADGLIAGVLDTSATPAVVKIYLSYGGSWHDSGGTMDVKTLWNILTDDVPIQQAIDQLEAEISNVSDAKADKVASATNNNFAALDANGNLKDSGHKHSDYATASQGTKADSAEQPTNKTTSVSSSSTDTQYPSAKCLYELAQILNIATCYFCGRKEEEGEVIRDNYADADPDKYCETIFYDDENNRFLFFDSAVSKYYTQWGNGGELAFMDDNGAVLMNKLYVDANGNVYYCNSDKRLAVITIESKADKVATGHNNEYAMFDAYGNLKLSGKSANDFELVSRKVSTFTDNVGDNTKYPSAKLVYDSLQEKLTIEDLGKCIGDAVRCTYVFDQTSDYTLCKSEDLVLAIIDGKAVLPEEDDIIYNATASETLTVSFIFIDPTKIPREAFMGTPVNSVHIPSYVRSIEGYAFADCTVLDTIDCDAITPPKVASNTFENVDMQNQVILIVHAMVKAYYQTATSGGNWAEVNDIKTYNDVEPI